MATRAEMEATYNYMDEVVRLSLGDNPDITCALYDGDYSKSLQQAQLDKHRYVLESIGFQPGWRVLDIGCGWGPILRAAQERGGRSVGITLSTKHAQACRRSALEAHVMDWKDLTVDTFGRFDGVVSIGAFEHFCSVEEYVAGAQDRIYERFFRICSDLLQPGRRLYLQTMIWGRRFPGLERISLSAPKGSDEHVLAVLEKFYPGSFLPLSAEDVVRVASPCFELESMKNGRRDYIETAEQWSVFKKPSFRKGIAALKLLPYFVRDRDFRYRLEVVRGGYMKECLKRDIMDHQRMVFQRT